MRGREITLFKFSDMIANVMVQTISTDTLNPTGQFIGSWLSTDSAASCACASSPCALRSMSASS